ncbi:hypothetical protein PENARI_c005G03067 [Penicillium arizonense]|uniref:Uncharacterized protein n=1 Tax=Penicillium arizonense TaxID=1835702 RepID=A0A1F5LP14_PENAI|nr:hypothetical protein PENARI_c005G03067 [Penicillium arizonense]
MLLHRIKR